jgi:hypothetical protein
MDIEAQMINDEDKVLEQEEIQKESERRMQAAKKQWMKEIR